MILGDLLRQVPLQLRHDRPPPITTATLRHPVWRSRRPLRATAESRDRIVELAAPRAGLTGGGDLTGPIGRHRQTRVGRLVGDPSK